MGFFAEFNVWLNAILRNYITDNTRVVATALEPAIVACATIYVMIWGYLHLTGKVEEPFATGLKRIILLAVILGISLELWLYNEIIVDTFFYAPGQLAARIIGTPDYVTIIDQIIFTGGDVAAALMEKGGYLNLGYSIAGVLVYIIVDVTAIYTIFLLALARVGLSVLLALGPFFIALLFFETTKRFFDTWIALMANFALTAILTVMIAALMMQVIGDAANQAASTGGAIEISHGVRVCMAAGLTFLVMRQVMTMAASLAGGFALGTMNIISHGIGRLLHAGRWSLSRGAAFGRGIFDSGSLSADTRASLPMSRRAGYYSRAGIMAGARSIGAGARNLAGRFRPRNRITPG